MTAVLVAGMVVTGAGPHAGDEDVPRFEFSVQNVARFHSVLVWLTLAWLVFVLVKWRSKGSQEAWFDQRSNNLLLIVIAQGGIGYWQYFTDVPAGLVGVHIAIATLLWAAMMRFWIESRSRFFRSA